MGKTEFFENADVNCPEHGARQTRDFSIIFLGPLASPVACLEINLGLLYVQEDKAKHIKAIFSASVEICTDVFREARDRRRIDDLGFD